MKKGEWVWMPHAGHLIVGNDCRFHLNTYVGVYVVSTVGEYWPDSESRKAKAKIHGKVIEGRGDEWDRNYFNEFGYDDIGLDRKYETMVFKAKADKSKCCQWRMASAEELDMEGYNDPEEAAAGHMRMCLKWAERGDVVR